MSEISQECEQKVQVLIGSSKNYYRIGEVTEFLEETSQTVRKWEKEYKKIRPQKGKTGQRVYHKKDIFFMLLIQNYLQDEYKLDKNEINKLIRHTSLKKFKQQEPRTKEKKNRKKVQIQKTTKIVAREDDIPPQQEISFEQKELLNKLLREAEELIQFARTDPGIQFSHEDNLATVA